MMVYFFIFIILHTLKVNELPSHSHMIPGYNYGNVGTNYLIFSTGGTSINLFAYDGNWGSNYKRYWESTLEHSTMPSEMRYRTWTLGRETNGSPTTESGNNERFKK